MVLEARRLVDEHHDEGGASLTLSQQDRDALNSLGYEQTAQHVYGMTYGEWKKRHQQKATEAQLQRYQESESWHAVHDAQLLEPRRTTVATVAAAASPVVSSGTSTLENSSHAIQAQKGSLLSNVCCEDVDAVAACPAPAQIPAAPPSAAASDGKPPNKSTREVGPFVPPPLPDYLISRSIPLRIGVLTVSDRAFRHEYATGDLSGPAVVHAVLQVLQGEPAGATVPPTIVTAIAPDEAEDIQAQLKIWCDDVKGPMDIILTTGEIRLQSRSECANCIDFESHFILFSRRFSEIYSLFVPGGTGLGPRDVTPEATRAVVSVECPGLLGFVISECSRHHALASLSRGTAGIRNTTVLANVPGNPQGASEVIPLLLPLLLHAVADLNGWRDSEQ